MKQQTKNLIYTLLDMIDVLQKSNIPVIDSLSEAKDELFGLLHNDNQSKNIDTIRELIGILPSLLIDKAKFPSNGDLVRFAEKSLNISVPSWEKKKREEIIGRIVYIIAEKTPNELQKFIEPWEKFNTEKPTEITKSTKKSNFVDIWLEFFDNYKK